MEWSNLKTFMNSYTALCLVLSVVITAKEYSDEAVSFSDPDPLKDVSDVSSDVTSDVSSDVLSDLLSDVPSDISSDVSSDGSSEESSDVSPDGSSDKKNG